MKVGFSYNICFVFSSQVEVKREAQHFFLSACVSDLHVSKAIFPGNIICNVCRAVGTPCKLGEATCPPRRGMSALVYDHLAGMAATQVCAGLLAAVSVTQSHQSTAPALSVLTGLCQPQAVSRLHRNMSL